MNCPAAGDFVSSTFGMPMANCWDFPFSRPGKTMPSIFDICEAVDWIEREIHEEYSIDFTGREYEPLLLRQGHRAGVNLHEVAK